MIRCFDTEIVGKFPPHNYVFKVIITVVSMYLIDPEGGALTVLAYGGARAAQSAEAVAATRAESERPAAAIKESGSISSFDRRRHGSLFPDGEWSFAYDGPTNVRPPTRSFPLNSLRLAARGNRVKRIFQFLFRQVLDLKSQVFVRH
jgi:hypothetical protein